MAEVACSEDESNRAIGSPFQRPSMSILAPWPPLLLLLVFLPDLLLDLLSKEASEDHLLGKSYGQANQKRICLVPQTLRSHSKTPQTEPRQPRVVRPGDANSREQASQETRNTQTSKVLSQGISVLAHGSAPQVNRPKGAEKAPGGREDVPRHELGHESEGGEAEGEKNGGKEAK